MGDYNHNKFGRTATKIKKYLSEFNRYNVFKKQHHLEALALQTKGQMTGTKLYAFPLIKQITEL